MGNGLEYGGFVVILLFGGSRAFRVVDLNSSSIARFSGEGLILGG